MVEVREKSRWSTRSTAHLRTPRIRTHTWQMELPSTFGLMGSLMGSRERDLCRRKATFPLTISSQTLGKVLISPLEEYRIENNGMNRCYGSFLCEIEPINEPKLTRRERGQPKQQQEADKKIQETEGMCVAFVMLICNLRWKRPLQRHQHTQCSFTAHYWAQRKIQKIQGHAWSHQHQQAWRVGLDSLSVWRGTLLSVRLFVNYLPPTQHRHCPHSLCFPFLSR